MLSLNSSGLRDHCLEGAAVVYRKLLAKEINTEASTRNRVDMSVLLLLLRSVHPRCRCRSMRFALLYQNVQAEVGKLLHSSRFKFLNQCDVSDDISVTTLYRSPKQRLTYDLSQ